LYNFPDHSIPEIVVTPIIYIPVDLYIMGRGCVQRVGGGTSEEEATWNAKGLMEISYWNGSLRNVWGSVDWIGVSHNSDM
jgi:hypothetical protein